MDAAVVLTTFALIFTAELPDKSMFASIVLATRFKPLPVWLGLASAFLVHVLVAVLAGEVISLLPRRFVLGAVTLFFFAGAALLLLKKDSAEEELAGETLTDVAVDVGDKSDTKVFATAFGLIFVSEWGDLTQLATINLAARYQDPASVAVGALIALWLVSGLGVLVGRRVVKVLPLIWVRRFAGTVLLVLGAWSFTEFWAF